MDKIQYIYLTEDLSEATFSSDEPMDYEDQTPCIVVKTDEDDMPILLNLIFGKE